MERKLWSLSIQWDCEYTQTLIYEDWNKMHSTIECEKLREVCDSMLVTDLETYEQTLISPKRGGEFHNLEEWTETQVQASTWKGGVTI